MGITEILTILIFPIQDHGLLLHLLDHLCILLKFKIFPKQILKFSFDLFLGILYFVEIIDDIYTFLSVFSVLFPMYGYVIYFCILVVYPAI